MDEISVTLSVSKAKSKFTGNYNFFHLCIRGIRESRCVTLTVDSLVYVNQTGSLQYRSKNYNVYKFFQFGTTTIEMISLKVSSNIKTY